MRVLPLLYPIPNWAGKLHLFAIREPGWITWHWFAKLGEYLSDSDNMLYHQLLVYYQFAPISTSVMTTKDPDKDVPVQGVKSWPSGELLTYDNGKIIPKEWFDDPGGSGLPALSDEETYTEILSIGLPRMPELEATIDMDQIDPELLK